MRWLIALLLVALLVLQYQLWLGEGGIAQARDLRAQLAEQAAENAELLARNEQLRAQVDDLQDGIAAIESLARSELGLVRKGEKFYQIIEPQHPDSGADGAQADPSNDGGR